METARDVPSVFDELRDSGYQLTPQREKLIERCLSMGEGHFTAEDLQEMEAQNGDKEFSRATVYNTLNVLVDVGFLRELNDMAESSYYELTEDVHPHAYCKSCGDLIDVPVNLRREVEDWNVSFQIEDVRMTLEGYCEDCSAE
jgi:Fe2+ or Zn2+ uptake regulation protein